MIHLSRWRGTSKASRKLPIIYFLIGLCTGPAVTKNLSRMRRLDVAREKVSNGRSNEPDFNFCSLSNDFGV